MSKWNDAMQRLLPGLIIVAVLALKIGPANIARRFDEHWNAAEIAKQKDVEMWESACEAHEAMLRSVTEPRFPVINE